MTPPAQHLAIGLTVAAGFSALVVIPAAANSGASPTPGPAELAAAARASADAAQDWIALDWTTTDLNPIPRDWTVTGQATPAAEVTGQRRAPVTPPTAKRAVEHQAAAPAPRRTKAPTVRRHVPRVAGQRADRPRVNRPWRPARPARVAFVEVQRGDTLSGIAARYGYTVAQLARHNGIDNADVIWVGQRIDFPAVIR